MFCQIIRKLDLFYFIFLFLIYLFRMAQLNTVHIKIYTRFLFSEVLIHTIVQSCNIRKYKINIKNIKNVKYMT